MAIKFRAKVKGLLSSLDSVISISTRGTTEDHDNAYHITFSASSDNITFLADGGRVSICNTIDTTLNDFDYAFISEGQVTVGTEAFVSTLRSFDTDEIVEIEESSVNPIEGENSNSGRELCIRLVSDHEVLQTVPVLLQENDIQIEEVVKKVVESKSIKIRRSLFIESAKRLIFAHGWKDNKPEYTYWVIRVGSGVVRFAAGSGSLFGILDFSGKDITDASNDSTLFIPCVPTQSMITALSSTTCEYITFTPGDRYLTIRCGSLHMTIVNIDSNIKWPNENDILNRNNVISLTTKINSWDKAIKGISATYTDDLKDSGQGHYVTISVKADAKVLHAKTEGTMKSNRKIPMDDVIVDATSDKTDYAFLSKYLAIAIGKTSVDEYVQFEIGEKTNAPIIVRFYAKSTVGDPSEFIKVNDMSGVSEKYSVFFASKPIKQ